MSLWEDFHFEERILEILRDTTYYQESHHFGRPFLTPYQIAPFYEVSLITGAPAAVEFVKKDEGWH